MADWLTQAQQLADEGFGQLTAVDRDGVIELWLVTAAGTRISCVVDSLPLPSLSSIWPAAAVDEAKVVHDFFEPGLLRKSVWLKARQDVAWPGLKDPADSSGSPSRRKSLPPGVLSDGQAEVELR